VPGDASVRELISGLVAAVRPLDEREAADQADVLGWVASGQPLFRTVPPDTPPKHLVVYFIPFDAANGCVLLGDHRKSGLWLPPGGHVEDGEDPRQAVVREAREELGIEAGCEDGGAFFVTVTPTIGANRHLDVSLWFVLPSVRRDARIVPDPGEFSSVRWFDLAQQRGWPAETYDPEMYRFAVKLEAVQGLGERYPGGLLSAPGHLYGGDRTDCLSATDVRPTRECSTTPRTGRPAGRRECPGDWGVVDVEAEYAPRHPPDGAVCDHKWRDLPAPVPPGQAG
jgi:8-oxo-dGTP diphosphatase